MLKEMRKKAKIEFLENKVKGYEDWLRKYTAEIEELKEQRKTLSDGIENLSRTVDMICFSLIKQFGKKDALIIDVPKPEDTFGKKVKAEPDGKGKLTLTVIDRPEEEEEKKEGN